jgi:putative ABC transport system permease protein
MFVVMLRGILAHKLRLLLSATAVALGISFLAGTMVLTDTIRHSTDQLEDSLATGSDVSVRSRSAVGGDVADRAPVPASALDTVRALPGVARATGSSVGFAQLVDSAGDVVGTGTPVGISMPPGDLLQVREGRAPRGLDEVVLDVGTAERSGLEVGDRVTLLLAGPSRPATLVGLVSYGDLTALPGASVVAFDPPVADRLVGTPGHFTTLEVTAADRTSPRELRSAVAAALPDDLQAVTGAQAADESVAAVRKAVRFIPMALMAFVAVSLFVAAFLIASGSASSGCCGLSEPPRARSSPPWSARPSWWASSPRRRASGSASPRPSGSTGCCPPSVSPCRTPRSRSGPRSPSSRSSSARW